MDDSGPLIVDNLPIGDKKGFFPLFLWINLGECDNRKYVRSKEEPGCSQTCIVSAEEHSRSQYPARDLGLQRPLSFCSHLQNPPGLRVYSLPQLGKEEILALAEFLDPGQRIVIGESVTRINEGEPFLHPEFLGILTGLRRLFPTTSIQITTNGMALTPAAISFLASLGRVRLVVSLNSATPLGRRKLMGDNDPAAVLRAVASLGDRGIPFDGSIVAMPHLVGWEDLRQTIAFLARWGAETIRIFLPGYTRYTRREWLPPAGMEEKLRAFVAEEGKGAGSPHPGIALF